MEAIRNLQKSIIREEKPWRKTFLILLISLHLFSNYSHSETINIRETKLLQSSELKKAHQLYQSKKYENAIRILQNKKSESFEDYRIWLLFQIKKDRFSLHPPKSDNEIEELRTLLYTIQKKYPYAGFIRNIWNEDAEIDFILAKYYLKKSQHKNTLQAFENGFQKLFIHHAQLPQLKLDSLTDYLKTLKSAKAISPLSRQWVFRFINIFPKSSVEGKVIQQYFPDWVLENLKSQTSITKTTLAYKSPDLDTAIFDKALNLFQQKEYSDSLSSIEQLLKDYPKTSLRHRARYLSAIILEKQEELEASNKFYLDLLKEQPLSFYGLQAGLKTKTPPEKLIHATLPTSLKTFPQLLPIDFYRINRASLLLTENLSEFASSELKNFRSRDFSSNEFIFYLANLNANAGNYANTFMFLHELFLRGDSAAYSSAALQLHFPLLYLDIIQKMSIQENVDPILILSLMKQESAFDAQISSSAGAIGLMQLMPTTAAELDPNIQRLQLISPEANIRLGTRYLKRMLNRYNGNIALALAAYNAGPGRVSRWIANRGNIEEELSLTDFIESIPFNETRDYVGNIIRNYYWYNRRINGVSLENLNSFWKRTFQTEPTSALPTEIINDDLERRNIK